MQLHVDITFRGMAWSDALAAAIYAWAGKLDELFGIEHCSVSIEQPHRHRQQGREFRVRLALMSHGREIAISREAGAGNHEHAFVAVSDAFRAARRKLRELTAARRTAQGMRPSV